MAASLAKRRAWAPASQASCIANREGAEREGTMHDFTAHVLYFVGEVVTPITLNTHKGSAIRGAFFRALRNLYCAVPEQTTCLTCTLHSSCPICFLVATVDDNSERGAEVPRPYIIQPPLDSKTDYQPGDQICFHLVLFAKALQLLPYVMHAAQRVGQDGLGRTRGQFQLREVWACNPLTGLAQRIRSRHDDVVADPGLPITHKQVLDRVAKLPTDRLAVRLRTPVRLVNQDRLVHQLSFGVLFQRLLERLSAISTTYASQPLSLDYGELIARANRVAIAEDDTHWLDVDRYSTRQGRPLPMGGLVGRICFAGDLEPFLPWLVWGEVVHVGKYAVMGNGRLELEAAEVRTERVPITREVPYRRDRCLPRTCSIAHPPAKREPCVHPRPGRQSR